MICHHQESNNRYDKEVSKSHNKRQHSLNGNINENDTVTILQLNTGNGKLINCFDRLKLAINDNNAKILVISESNFDAANPGEKLKRAKEFPNHSFEDKELSGSSNARISMMICKSLEYERLLDCENDINTAIVIRIKRLNKKWSNIMGIYRQWQGSSASCAFNGKDRTSALERFRELIKIKEKVMKLPGEKLFAGDYNIDRLPQNNPIDRQDLKLLIPELENFIASHNLVQLNWLATRHRTGQRSTLIDLFFSTAPDKCTNCQNVINLTSEHEGVRIDMNINKAVIKQQFAIVRNQRALNAHSLLEELKAVNYFTEESKLEDVTEITNAVKSKLNSIVTKLAPFKRIQLKTKTLKIKSKKAKDLLEKAKIAKTIAIKNKDPELQKITKPSSSCQQRKFSD